MDMFKLVTLLTEQDRKDSARKGYNIWALGHCLRAADETMEDIKAGAVPAVAFAKHFNPTRSNHRIATKLGLGLDVQRGNWVVPLEAKAGA